MLKHLYIKNYAIIDEINISFENGLTIITGETGAGKSILMGALGKILGERADSKFLLNETEKCIIEGTFLVANNKKISAYLHENNLDEHDELIIRREITPNGKSRIFINDTPSTLQVLNPLANLLIDLHRQFDTIELQDAHYQLQIVDEIAQLQTTLQAYQQTFLVWKKKEQELKQIQEKNKLIKQELDYNQFLFDELFALKLKENEIENLESELSILQNSDTLKQHLAKASNLLLNDDESIVSNIKATLNILENQAKNSSLIQQIVERLQSTYVEVKDISNEVEDLFLNTNFDEEKINKLTERLNEANRLLKKHHVNDTQSLLQIQQLLEEKIAQATHADESEQILLQQIEQYKIDIETHSKALTQLRKKQFGSIEKNINALLQKVGMPNATLQLQHTETDFTLTGKDKIEFLLDANKTQKFQPIHKAASGGELSRLMLCIKSMLAGSNQMPTLIFDEIDTGISGEVALQVGNIMKELANQHQLISITHLPQIAAKANQHLFIYKQENKQGHISTKVRKLTDDERIDTIAEMLSGKETNIQTKETAKMLIG